MNYDLFNRTLKSMKTSDITIESFYDYEIKSFSIDNITYYSVSNLLNQYNKNNGTKYQIKHWFATDSTQRYLNYLYEILGGTKWVPPKSLENYRSPKNDFDNSSEKGVSYNIHYFRCLDTLICPVDCKRPKYFPPFEK